MWRGIPCHSDPTFWGLRSENVASTPATQFPLGKMGQTWLTRAARLYLFVGMLRLD
jgi:hypothetical protein